MANWLRDKSGRLVYGIETTVNEMGPWSPTVAQIRDTILNYKIVGPQLSQSMSCEPIARTFEPTNEEVNEVSLMARDAVTKGCMIDFGMLPNDVMIKCAGRAGPLWNKGAFTQPFNTWIFLHTWEEGSCVYLVHELDNNCFEVCELNPIWLGANGGCLAIGDRGHFMRDPDTHQKYNCKVAPNAPRFATDMEMRNEINNGGTPENAAAGNIGDPMLTALLILSTKNVVRETVPAPERLNRQRIRKNRYPIPPYDIVHTKQYITAIRNSRPGDKTEWQGGTHNTPVPHIRMGHIRHYKSGAEVIIDETLVNVPEEQRRQFKFTRSHYTVK